MTSYTLLAVVLLAPLSAAEIPANPSNYRALLSTLKPGDTLHLAAGQYRRLSLNGINGVESGWITITGPASGPPAVIVGEEDHNTVEIFNCSYLALESLRIDSRGIPGAFGISARGHEANVTHHIRIEGNTLVGQNGGQQTDGISTKTPTWGWVIRYNRILGAGTGLYLGDSDGTQPFVDGLIENNLIQNSIGYNLEIKHQVFLPDVPGLPLEPTATIIRNNVFIKDDRPSPDGDRPNVLIGGAPASGNGSLNTYEIYGNTIVHNHREVLFQGSGRLSLHDNIFVDGPGVYAAIFLTKREIPLKVALVYNNTIYTTGKGIQFGSRPEVYDHVAGNLVFASTGITGPVLLQDGNMIDSPRQAASYVTSPSFELGSFDFFPLAGKCQGAPLDLSDFHTDTRYAVDFNGTPKVKAKGAVVYRGAYAGDGANPGWRPAADLPPPVVPAAAPAIVWAEPLRGSPDSAVHIKLTGANFRAGSTIAITGTAIDVQDLKVISATEITATLRIAPAAARDIRTITVNSPAGVSNPVKFRVQ